MKNFNFFIRVSLVAALTLLLGAVQSQAQNAYYFQETAQFDEAIPAPEEFLGYPVGSHYTRFDRIVSYFETLASLSDRAELQVIGQTVQLRPQIILTISAPENLQRIDEIREHHVGSITGGRNADAPSVVTLGYSVHGNESSGAETALLTAYYYVAETSSETLEQLRNVVINIDPALNPDGHDRAAHWFNSYKSFPPVADPADLEHNEVWPNGRTNHFLHDLNRDWLAGTQQESRSRVDFYHSWYPNIQIDFHEMGTNSTYYLEPTQPIRTWNPVIPDYRYEVLSPLIAGYQIEALDEIGALFWTKEVFDNISPIYGSTYPDIFGAVGITFEVGSSRGLLQESVHGDVSFASTIKKQVRTGLATINAAVGEREVLHAYQNDFFSTALEQASSQSVRGFVFGDENDKNLTQNFLELLLLHRVDVYKLGSETTQDGNTFKTDASYVVPANQAFYRIVHDIFQPNTAFRDSVFYDITAWSLVQGYGIQHSEISGRSFPQLLGDKVTEAPGRSGNVFGASTGYAYIFDWSDINASAALYALQQDGFLVRTAHRPFSTQTTGGVKEFGYGSVIVSVAEQRNQSVSDVHAYLSELATKHTIDIYAVQGGLSTTGIDLGSRYSVVTPKPEVALLFGPGLRNYEAGEVWFSLNNHVGLPVSRITFDRFARTDLRRYTTIILVDGNYSEWGESEIDALKTWVRQGGTLITQSGATRWAIQNELVSTVKLKDISADDSLAVLRFDYGESDDRRRASRIPGVIFESDLDLTHPLAFGATSRRQLFLKNNQTHVLPSENPYGTVALYGDEPFVGGHINSENLNRVRNTGAVSVESIGRGNVILFTENPNFRSYWHSTNRLFLNAIFHGHSISNP